MLTVVRRSSLPLLVLLLVLLAPSAAFAQGAITGVVKDASGAVLPGATVEAASPVLIEKVRAVVTDDTGRYRIVDLRPGTYSVTFGLTGFSSVKREGIELSGNFVATVDASLTVGQLAETVTVTGESPIVDVQSTRTQAILNRDVLASIPSSRNINGIQAIIPGMSVAGDDGGIGGTMQGGTAMIHGGRANDTRIYADGVNMGWAGTGGGGGQMPQVAAALQVRRDRNADSDSALLGTLGRLAFVARTVGSLRAGRDHRRRQGRLARRVTGHDSGSRQPRPD